MKKSITITTTNSAYSKFGECEGGIHEIHEISGMFNPHQLIDTIKSIVTLNKKYVPYKLEEITISFPDNYMHDIETIKAEIEKVINVRVYVEEYVAM